jgi:hypothetical protein
MSARYLTYYVPNLARMEREILYLVKKTVCFLTFIFQKLFSKMSRSIGSVFSVMELYDPGLKQWRYRPHYENYVKIIHLDSLWAPKV